MNPKKTLKFSQLSREHQREIIGNLGQKAAQTTVWELIPDFPADHAAMIADDTSITIFNAHVELVTRQIERDGEVLRPILIDELDEDSVWMEGRHRSFASQELGLKTIPALYRVK